jgi:hypothetical protein
VKKKHKRKPSRPKPKRDHPSQGHESSEKSPTEHRRWIRTMKWIVGTLVVANAGFVASIYQLWGGPPWPVEPSFAPGFPSSGSAFDVPFTITNKSALFSLNHLEILCGFEKVLTDKNSGLERLSISASDGKATLEPLQSATYICPLTRMFNFPGAKIETATITFISKYDSRFPWAGKVQSQSDSFSLNTNTTPPQWMVGKVIK